jgi:hypothetical protein
MDIKEMTLEEIYDFEFEHSPLIGTRGKFFGVPEEQRVEPEAERASGDTSPLPAIIAIAHHSQSGPVDSGAR